MIDLFNGVSYQIGICALEEVGLGRAGRGRDERQGRAVEGQGRAGRVRDMT